MTYWGIIGLGSIAHHFVKDLALVPEAKLYGVASRSLEKANNFAREYSAEKAFIAHSLWLLCGVAIYTTDTKGSFNNSS